MGSHLEGAVGGVGGVGGVTGTEKRGGGVEGSVRG